MTKPLVTVLGASGYVGAAVSAAFAHRPVRLRLVGRDRTPAPPGGVAQTRIGRAELTSRDELAHAVRGSDVVVHLVAHSGGWRRAEHDHDSHAVNVGVVRDLVEVLGDRTEPPLVLYAGAASQVGVPPGGAVDGTEPDHPETGYDEQKLAAERVVEQASRAGAVRGVVLRLPTVFGESPGGAERGVVAHMVRRALAGEPLTMWHDGTVRRDFLHVADVAAAFVAAFERPDDLLGGHWPIGSGRPERLGDVLRRIADLVAGHTGEPPVPVVSVPPPEGAPVTDFRDLTIDPRRFRSRTGWSPQVPLREGLDRTVLAALGRVPEHQ